MKGKFYLISFRRSEEVCEIGTFFFAGVILSHFLFKSFFCGGYGISFKFFGVLTAFIWFIY